MKRRVLAALLAALLALSVTGCSSSKTITGKMGENIKTYFFDFTVQDAYREAALSDYTPEDGHDLLIVELTVYNTFKDTIPMYDGDFQIQWGDGDEDYGWPISDVNVMMIFPEQYDLDPGKVQVGKLVYEVPADATEFSIAHLDQFDNDTTGDVYFVEFSVPAGA